MGILGEPFYNHHDDQLITYLGKPHNKIHRDIGPNGGKDGKGLEGVRSFDQFTFVALECVIFIDKIENILLHSYPKERALSMCIILLES